MPTFLFSRRAVIGPRHSSMCCRGVTVLPRRVLAASSTTKSHCWGFEPVERVLVVPLSFHSPSAKTVEMFTAEPVIDGTHQPQLLQLLGVQPSRMGPTWSYSVGRLLLYLVKVWEKLLLTCCFFLIVILGIPVKCKVKLRQIAKTKRHLFTISLDLQSNCNSHTKAELKREKKHCQDELQFLWTYQTSSN